MSFLGRTYIEEAVRRERVLSSLLEERPLLAHEEDDVRSDILADVPFKRTTAEVIENCLRWPWMENLSSSDQATIISACLSAEWSRETVRAVTRNRA